MPNTGENLSLTRQGGLQQKRGTKKWEKCGRSSNLLLRQLCEAQARVLDIIDRPLISKRGQNHYSNRLNWLRRKQNQRRLLTPLALSNTLRKKRDERKKVLSMDLKQEQHENNRFEPLSQSSLCNFHCLLRLLNNVQELNACSSSERPVFS